MALNFNPPPLGLGIRQYPDIPSGIDAIFEGYQRRKMMAQQMGLQMRALPLQEALEKAKIASMGILPPGEEKGGQYDQLVQDFISKRATGLSEDIRKTEPQSMDALLAQKVYRGEMPIEEAFKYKTELAAARGPQSIDALLAQKVMNGELSLEDAMKHKLEQTTGPKIDMETKILDIKNKFKIEKEKPKAYGSLQNTLREYDNMISEAKSISNDPSLELATGLSAPLGGVPGTGAKRVAARLETLKAKTLLSVLASLKELSSTGASGFGQLSNIEGENLRNSISTLDRSLATKDFKSSMDRFISEMEQRKNNLVDVFKNTYGDISKSSIQTPVRTRQMIIEDGIKANLSNEQIKANIEKAGL